MVSLADLWMPIVVSAVIVFLASSVIHMVLKYHNPDYKRLSNEDEVRAAIRKGAAQPGQYVMPWCLDPKEGCSPEMKKKFEEGPVGVLWVRRSGAMSMGPLLLAWFVYSLVISLFAGYVAAHTLAPGVHYLAVFRIVGTVAFLGYAGGHLSNTIWKGQPGAVSLKNHIDGLIYGLLTAGTFGWLWPS